MLLGLLDLRGKPQYALESGRPSFQGKKNVRSDEPEGLPDLTGRT